jgi:hypothetical protein
LLASQQNLATRRRVLRRVVQQILKHLRQPSGIAIEPQHLGRHLNRERVPPGFDRGTGGFESVGENATQTHAFALQRHLPKRDARDLHEVVDEPHHVLHLAVDDVARDTHLQVRRIR